MHRLDYEQSEAVEIEISKLLYLNFFNKNMSSEDRYRIVNGMCRLNRTASLDFHRLLNTIDVTTVSSVLAHMRSVLTVCSRALKRLEEIKDRMSDSQEETSQDDETTMEVQDQTTAERDELDKRRFLCQGMTRFSFQNSIDSGTSSVAWSSVFQLCVMLLVSIRIIWTRRSSLVACLRLPAELLRTSAMMPICLMWLSRSSHSFEMLESMLQN